MTLPHYLNGRVLLRPPGGVRRYASEVAELLPGCQTLTPRSARHPWSARIWEQTTLAHKSAEGVLLNVAHSGPLRHTRHVMVVHDLIALTDRAGVRGSYRALLRQQLPRLVSTASRVVTVSRQVADELTTQLGVSPDRQAVVPPGISSAFVSGDREAACTRLGLDPDRPVAAALLDPTPRKNAGHVATILRQLMEQRPGLQVVVAGQHRAPAFAQKPGPGQTRRTGFIDLGPAADIELATMYQAADIALFLSSAEGFGLPQVEAAKCGAAVVTTPVPSISELAPEAALTIAGRAEALATCDGLLVSPDRRAELADAAANALGDLQWARTAASLDSIMTEVGQP